ncbi:flavin reductase family protein [Krasilnikoviella flava]|uniref:NADH-FMN oxidoreductase RutF, flavin reductase (DIM6/NTAB) family n=1 Tax=Krasilnikoviella flava TaxID=526729 RepID=A0A1T5KQN7_9MICO|nr:flavin reductase family protein [Krasilnikoviella flava]SKC65963.1 NADH-FMN oxidoreductase RutF, flavin reductase (DIM6/NTAB) family [Krasilnikoviella flava]
MTSTDTAGIPTPQTTGHVAVDPAILYFGTPVVLLSSTNADGTTNLMPMSSVFWLGRSAVLGIGARSQTASNLRRNPELVLNLASPANVAHVDRLALTTGRPDVSPWKTRARYVHVADKFAAAGLTPLDSATVRPRRVAECLVHLEAVVRAIRPLGTRPGDDPESARQLTVEAHVTRVWVDPAIRLTGHADRIDPDLWRPLILSFQRFYGLGVEVHPSRLAGIDEDRYREPRTAS